jgi:hypothetical protein
MATVTIFEIPKIYRELNTQAVVREMKKREEEERRIAKITEAKEDARRR